MKLSRDTTCICHKKVAALLIHCTNPNQMQAAEEEQRRRIALETGEKLDAPAAAGLLGSLYEESGVVAVSAALKKLNVEGGLAGKMCALYDGLFGCSDAKVGGCGLWGARGAHGAVFGLQGGGGEVHPHPRPQPPR